MDAVQKAFSRLKTRCSARIKITQSHTSSYYNAYITQDAVRTVAKAVKANRKRKYEEEVDKDIKTETLKQEQDDHSSDEDGDEFEENGDDKNVEADKAV
jgi:hypothetical protein